MRLSFVQSACQTATSVCRHIGTPFARRSSLSHWRKPLLVSLLTLSSLASLTLTAGPAFAADAPAAAVNVANAGADASTKAEGQPSIQAVPVTTVATSEAPADNTPPTITPFSPSPEPLHVVRLSTGPIVASDIAPILQRGELVVAMLGVDTPPLFYEKDGQLVGIEVDLAKDLARALGVKVRFDRSAKSFDAVVQMLAAGKADVAISKLSQTLARTREISYTKPYLVLNRALLLNRVQFAALARKRSLPEVIRSYDGTLGVIANSSYQDYARVDFPHAKIVQYPTWDALIQAVKSGEVVAAYRDEFEIKRLLKIDPTISLTLRTVTFKDLTDTLAIGVRVDEPTLLAFTNEFLSERNTRLDVNKLLDAIAQ